MHVNGKAHAISRTIELSESFYVASVRASQPCLRNRWVYRQLPFIRRQYCLFADRSCWWILTLRVQSSYALTRHEPIIRSSLAIPYRHRDARSGCRDLLCRSIDTCRTCLLGSVSLSLVVGIEIVPPSSDVSEVRGRALCRLDHGGAFSPRAGLANWMGIANRLLWVAVIWTVTVLLLRAIRRETHARGAGGAADLGAGRRATWDMGD